MVAVGVIFALSAVFMSQDSLVFKGRERVGRVLTVAGHIAVGLHRRGAPLALELYVKRVEADSGHRLFLFRDGKRVDTPGAFFGITDKSRGGVVLAYRRSGNAPLLEKTLYPQ